MEKITKIKPDQHFENSIDEITLENVTVSVDGFGPLLQSVDFALPTDQTIVIESSRPQQAVYFLQLLSGRLQPESGRLLWNQENIFSDEVAVDPHQQMGCFFEGGYPAQNMKIHEIWKLDLKSENFSDLVEHFELQNDIDKKFSEFSYSLQKLCMLVRAVLHSPTLLILEDPAQGLNEKHWLDFLDHVQFLQRQGGIRHVFMSNTHPVAMRHLAHNKIYVEDGLLYFDQEAGYKKASHF